MTVLKRRVTARKTARISGAFDTEFGRLDGASCLSLHAEAAYGAVADAGLDMGDIDGVLTAYSTVQPDIDLANAFCQAVGIRPDFVTSIRSGDASAAVMVQTAAALVLSGACRHVLCVTGEARLSGRPSRPVPATRSEFEESYGLSLASSFAMIARRYMHEHGTTAEQLGEVARVQRRHAALTDRAYLRTPIPPDDPSETRMVSDPIRAIDVSSFADGGAAVIVSAPETSDDLTDPRIALLGAAQAVTHDTISAAPSLSQFGSGISGPAALARAGVAASDIDLVELTDGFTISPLIHLEAAGFYRTGEAGLAVMRGDTALGGRLPCNSHGGLLSYGHAGAAGGMAHIVEAVRQLRGGCGARQVAGAETAFVHGDGGALSSHASMVLGRI